MFKRPSVLFFRRYGINFQDQKGALFFMKCIAGKMSQKRALESIDEEDESIGPMPDETALRKKPKGGSYIVCK